VWSAVIIAGDPGPHGGGPFGRGQERFDVGPVAQAGLDEALGFALGARGIGSGPLWGMLCSASRSQKAKFL
jgi:hypothetical protein